MSATAKRKCSHLMHLPSGKCLGCGEQHQPLGDYQPGDDEAYIREHLAEPVDPLPAMKAAEPLPQGDVERVAREICNGLRARPVANKWIVAAPAMIEQLLTRAALVRSKPDDVRERVARALCEASGQIWRTRDEVPACGLPRDYDFDALNNHWRHKADAAITAIGSQSIEGERRDA